jgi:hypothetical protein
MNLNEEWQVAAEPGEDAEDAPDNAQNEVDAIIG